MEITSLNSSAFLHIGDLVNDEYKQSISALIEENTHIKNKLAITQEVLRRYKLNDVTELMKEIKDMKNCIGIMKESASTMNEKISQQNKEIDQLQKVLSEKNREIERLQRAVNANNVVNEDPNENLQERFGEIEKEKANAEIYMKKCSSLVGVVEEMRENLKNSEVFKLKYNELKAEYDKITAKKQENDKNAGNKNRFAHSARKLEMLSSEKKKLEEKNQELENDKKKLLEKWQNSLDKSKTDDKSKLKLKQLEDYLDLERKKSDIYLLKLKDLNKKHEDSKEQYLREKAYSDELTLSYKKLHTQSKILYEEKELLTKMNQDLNIKLHKSQAENPQPSQKPSNQEEIISNLQSELSKSLFTLKRKSQDILSLEFKVAESQIANRKMEQQLCSTSENSMLIEKYESLLEKYQKIQAEKTQIQSLYIDSSSIISEKNLMVQELTQKVGNLEEKVVMLSQKSYENTKGHINSISNTTTSRGTSGSSPARFRASREFLYSKFESKLAF